LIRDYIECDGDFWGTAYRNIIDFLGESEEKYRNQ
jgi:hypothetical protein